MICHRRAQLRTSVTLSQTRRDAGTGSDVFATHSTGCCVLRTCVSATTIRCSAVRGTRLERMRESERFVTQMYCPDLYLACSTLRAAGGNCGSDSSELKPDVGQDGFTLQKLHQPRLVSESTLSEYTALKAGKSPASIAHRPPRLVLAPPLYFSKGALVRPRL